jgi:hypothetical protein
MSITQATSAVLAANAALNNLNAGANITFTKQVVIPSLGGDAFGTGVINFLANPTSANLAAAVTNETGTGALVFGTSPTLTTPTIARINPVAFTPLTIVGNAISQDGVLSIRNTNSALNSVIRFDDWTSNSRGVIGVGNTTTALYPSAMYVQGTSGIALVLGTNNAERMRILSTGQIGIGTNTPNASAALDISSTTRGFLPPRMTSAERDLISTPPDGLEIYNTTTSRPNVRSGEVWLEIPAVGSNVASFLTAPTSANLAAAVSDETGTGALVFGTSPTIDSPTITGTAAFAGSNRPSTTATGTPSATSLITRNDVDERVMEYLLTERGYYKLLSTWGAFTNVGSGSGALSTLNGGIRIATGATAGGSSLYRGNPGANFRFLRSNNATIGTEWTRKITLGWDGQIDCRAGGTWRLQFGRVNNTTTISDLSNTDRGIGLILNGTTGALIAEAANGTTRVASGTLATLPNNAAFWVSVRLVASGGTLTVFINDVQVGTLSGSPTTNSGTTANNFHLSIENGATNASYLCDHYETRIFVSL